MNFNSATRIWHLPQNLQAACFRRSVLIWRCLSQAARRPQWQPPQRLALPVPWAPLQTALRAIQRHGWVRVEQLVRWPGRGLMRMKVSKFLARLLAELSAR
jgi:hypothetical protein